MKLPIPPLLVISDRQQTARPLEEIAQAAFAGGCRWFSLREKDLPAAKRRALLRKLIALGGGYAATIMVHDDLDAAINEEAAGVHLPSGSNPAEARARFPCALIGASAHSDDEAAALLRAGAHYVTLSPVFITPSKPGYGPALGLDGLAVAVRHASGPVIALGGIDAGNAAACFAAGAQGVAVMGEIMRAAAPEATVADIVRAISVR
jgi:thiamine-phosphate pyrophosphorylase